MGKEYLPVLAMVTVQVALSGMNVLSKLAMDFGMNPLILIVYRQAIAAVVLAPIACFLERKTCPKINRRTLFQIFLCALFGATLNPLFYFFGLKFSSPTIGCALTNILPAVTYIISLPFGLETIGIRTKTQLAKLVGTVLCVGGSMVMTFYKGGLLKMHPSGIHWKFAEEMAAASNANGGGSNIILGSAFVLVSCTAWSLWFITQAKMSKNFSSPYVTSAMMCAISAVLCFIIGASTERHFSKWALGWDIRLGASLYNGFVGSGVAISLMGWSVEKRGPLFVSTFSPLLLIIVAVMGWAFLEEKLYIGSVIGSILIVGGLYTVLWGKRGEQFKKVENGGGKTGDEKQERGWGSGATELPVYQSPTNQASGGRA